MDHQLTQRSLVLSFSCISMCLPPELHLFYKPGTETFPELLCVLRVWVKHRDKPTNPANQRWSRMVLISVYKCVCEWECCKVQWVVIKCTSVYNWTMICSVSKVFLVRKPSLFKKKTDNILLRWSGTVISAFLNVIVSFKKVHLLTFSRLCICDTENTNQLVKYFNFSFG